jgi:poly-gamma-glutamate capsule biosynthesis protein CapA/YwtB (metallophosphatase superfamily)
MKRVRRQLQPLLVLVLALVAVSAAEGKRRGPLPLDACDSLLNLTILPENGTVRLTWQDFPGVTEYVVYRATEFDLHDLTTAAVVRDTNTWTEFDSVLAANPRLFYCVTARWTQGSPDNYVVIEDFEEPVELTSYSGEDLTPDAWRRVSDGAYNPYGQCLELYGNNWKRQNIDTIHAGPGSLWRVAMKVLSVGEGQAIGVADSANDLWFGVWGREVRQSEAWDNTYQGWYSSDQWVFVDLPVGDDFKGRFGYYPNITALLYANDNDATSGVLRIDEIRDVTGTVTLPPYARFQWHITSPAGPDSFDVAFCSMGCDLDGPLYRTEWSLGDGSRAFLSPFSHRYRTGGEYKVVLTVVDSLNRASFVRHSVYDTVVAPTRSITALFTGDIMMARRYETEGIIPNLGVNAIFERVQPLVSSVELATCNLECPLTNATTHHPTKSIYFKGRPEYVGGLTYAGFDFCALGNNHIMDYMEAGMEETIHIVDSAGLLYTGAGENDEAARRPVFFSKNGLCVAVLSFCNRDGSFDNEQPFLGSGPGRAGFAMWDRANIELAVPAARALADLVVVQVHSGIEYAEQPPELATTDARSHLDWTPVMELLPDTSDVALRRYALDLGADVVINHHPHVIEGCEFYHGKLIAHSMGNFAFDQTYPETFLSMAITADLTADRGVCDFQIHPIYIDHYIPGPATGELGGAILDYMSELSRPRHAWVVRNPGGDVGFIVSDSAAPLPVGEDFQDTLWLEERDGYAISDPFRMRGQGYPVLVGLLAGDSAVFRCGRDVLFFGNMEAEGATPWDLNSNYERYDTLVARRGQRSIGLNRAGGGTNSVSTNLLLRPPFNPSLPYTMLGWMMANQGREVRIQFELYGGRTGGTAVSQQIIENSFAGSFDWMMVWDDVVAPSNGYYYNVRVNLRAPSSGQEGHAWFDDLALVQWENWQSGPAWPDFPNSLQWVQVRAPSGTITAVVEYRREWLSESRQISRYFPAPRP